MLIASAELLSGLEALENRSVSGIRVKGQSINILAVCIATVF